MLKTKCACCGKYLIEEGDFSYSEIYGEENDWIVVNLHCPNCLADVQYIVKETNIDIVK